MMERVAMVGAFVAVVRRCWNLLIVSRRSIERDLFAASYINL